MPHDKLVKYLESRTIGTEEVPIISIDGVKPCSEKSDETRRFVTLTILVHDATEIE